MAATSRCDLFAGARYGLTEEREAGPQEQADVRRHVVHHALRHPGRAAGVEHVDVVLAAGDALHRFVGREHLVVGRRAGHLAGAAVVDLDQQLQLRQPIDDLGDAVAERGVEHQSLGIGVVEQVPQLVVEVAVVDVDRHTADLEGAVLSLEVLVAVVHVQPDLAVGPESGSGVCSGQPCGPLVVLRPGLDVVTVRRLRSPSGSCPRSTPRWWRSATPWAGSVGDQFASAESVERRRRRRRRGSACTRRGSSATTPRPRRLDSRQELVETVERGVGDIVQHDHRPRMLVDLGQRGFDPSVGVAPIAGQHVPQHAGVPERAKRRRAERAHQSIIDHATGTIRTKQQPVAAHGVDGRRGCASSSSLTTSSSATPNCTEWLQVWPPRLCPALTIARRVCRPWAWPTCARSRRTWQARRARRAARAPAR